MWCANAALAGEQTFGDITDIDAAKKTILVSSECECGSGKIIETNFTIGDETKFSLNKKDCKFTDLKLGDQVEVDFEIRRSRHKNHRGQTMKLYCGRGVTCHLGETVVARFSKPCCMG